MKPLVYLLLSIIVGISTSHACTTFLVSKNGRLAFGRNYDWVSDAGLVCTNLKGLAKTSSKYPDGSTISWVSKYGSITFNQYGKEHPTGGMNDQGLVVELMWLDGSEYPKPDDRAALGILQWIQYQLDNCSTIDEVIATDKKIRNSTANPPIHYLVADSRGHAATIEFLKGKMIVHKGSDLPLPVLTNTDYETSAKKVKEMSENAGVSQGVSFSDNSLQRFANACSMLRNYQLGEGSQPIIDFSFDVLQNVSVKDFTRWSIVYDITNKTVFFKTNRFPEIKSIAFSKINFDCQATPLAADMNQKIKGDIVQHLKPLTREENMRTLSQAALESKSQVVISEAEIKKEVDYAAAIKCK